MELKFNGESITDIKHVEIYDIDIPVTLQRRRNTAEILGRHGNIDIGDAKFENFFITAKGVIAPACFESYDDLGAAKNRAMWAMESLQSILFSEDEQGWGELVTPRKGSYTARAFDLVVASNPIPGSMVLGETYPAYEFEILFECKPFRDVGETVYERFSVRPVGDNFEGQGSKEIKVVGTAPVNPVIDIEFQGGFTATKIEILYVPPGKMQGTVGGPLNVNDAHRLVLGDGSENVLTVNEILTIDCENKTLVKKDERGNIKTMGFAEWQPGSEFIEFLPGTGEMRVNIEYSATKEWSDVKINYRKKMMV